jgi:hypothetical protein
VGDSDAGLDAKLVGLPGFAFGDALDFRGMQGLEFAFVYRLLSANIPFVCSCSFLTSEATMTWAEEEFAGADLGDKRLNRRLVKWGIQLFTVTTDHVFFPAVSIVSGSFACQFTYGSLTAHRN